MGRILVVDDEPSVRELLSIVLEKEGHSVSSAVDGVEALRLAKDNPYDLVISDIKMPRMDGLRFLSGLREFDREIPVIMITAYPSTESAIEAMKQGAYDYLTKPFKIEEVKLVVAKALEALTLKRENVYLRRELQERHRFPGIIGSSPKMLALYELMEKVAGISSTVLITGESGTGKELVARAIHYNGPRADRPFVAINCGAIPEQLLESELFGHVKGSFTGAVSNKAGLFEVANGGTLFLDEVAETSPAIQVKLLRVLQDRVFRRVGGTEDIKVDVRLVAATNKDLKEAIQEGRFREDLYYRLNVIPLHLPSLRERREDIPALVLHFLKKYGEENHREGMGISPEAVETLERYPWPGNVRELENVIERAVALESLDILTPNSLPEELRRAGAEAPEAQKMELPPEGVDLEDVVASLERDLILSALERASWVQTRAAQMLGINFRSFRYRLKKHGIDGKTIKESKREGRENG
ncbi:MAG: sigma-54-dependent Fis family transcriptional regulator [candidate division NC10 bacterium]|nr:sigma-54-dependent Fis family transcriptional regulator [candidate division NC10 bacterium]